MFVEMLCKKEERMTTTPHTSQMHEAVATCLRNSFLRQAQSFCAQAERRSDPHHGFLLKVNGSQLHSAIAKQQKRPRDEDGNISSANLSTSTYNHSAGVWPKTVLLGLAELLDQVGEKSNEDENGAASPITAGADASVRRALRVLVGIEMRHCQLEACHLFSDSTESLTVFSILLSPSRPWNVKSPLPSLASTAITTIDLECNLLGSEGVGVLCADVLHRLPQLRRLHLASNNITAEGFLILLHALSSRKDEALQPLEVLGLTNNPVGTSSSDNDSPCSESVDAWCSAVDVFVQRFSSTLRRIHLNHAGLSTVEVTALLRALVTNVPSGGDAGVFDVVYLRENALVAKDSVLCDLAKHSMPTGTLANFVEKHVLW